MTQIVINFYFIVNERGNIYGFLTIFKSLNRQIKIFWSGETGKLFAFLTIFKSLNRQIKIFWFGETGKLFADFKTIIEFIC